MSKIIIGCDPDSDKSGFAIYKNGSLHDLLCMRLLDFIDFCESNKRKDMELHIENVCGTSPAFTANKAPSQAAKLKVAQNIGQCKQVQIEIERIATSYNIKIVHHPISSKWKKTQGEFKKLTGWQSRSNEDTRSAAYFGYVGVLRNK